MALIDWGEQQHLGSFKEEVVIVVPRDPPEIMTKLEEICDRNENATLHHRDNETFFIMEVGPGMGRRAYEQMLGLELSRELFVKSPAGRFSLD